MAITTVLFDMDGTLLPMDNDEFTKGYFKLLAAKLIPHGYNADELVAAVWKGMGAMVGNDGSRSNHDAFWEAFAEALAYTAITRCSMIFTATNSTRQRRYAGIRNTPRR